MKKVIAYCKVKNRWVGMVYYKGGMVRQFFSAKPKIRQLNGIAKKARNYIGVNKIAKSALL